MNEGTFLLTALDVMIYFALNRMLNTIVSDSQAILLSWKLRLATLIEGIEVSQTSDDYSQSYAVLAQSSQRSIRSRSNTQLNYWFPIT
jgi:hypothetical protein